MNANEKLVDYILNLTEEKVNKLYENLPLLKSAIEDKKIVSSTLSTATTH